MIEGSFFKEQSEQSQVKATIVAKYFYIWANIIISTQKRYPKRSSNKIAYIDLFAGPGRYENGKKSTPIKIIEIALENPDICDRLVTIFNDKDENNTRSLEKTLACIPNIEKLKFKP